ncbi:MAG: contact-dependent growth inhibition system immunity protein [Flavobacteriales bacterium]
MKPTQIIESLLSNSPDLEKTIPQSIQALKEDMFVKSKFYEGDLLMTVLVVEEDFWKENPILWQELIDILETQSDKIQEQQVSFEMKVDWYEKIDGFRKISF